MSDAEIVADAGRFRHLGLTINHEGNRAERIEREVFLGEDPGRERQHLQFIGKPHFLQHPERTERARAVAVIERDHQELPLLPGSVPIILHRTISMTSSAPPPIDVRRLSREARLTGVSLVKPIPPQYCQRAPVSPRASRPAFSLAMAASFVTSSPATSCS